MKLFLLILTLLYTAILPAQTLSGSLLYLVPSTTTATCRNGDIRVDTASTPLALKLCSSNVWGPLIPNQWLTNGTSIYYNTGNVGIGISSPTAKLHIAGSNASAIIQDTAYSGAESSFAPRLLFNDKDAATSGSLGYTTGSVLSLSNTVGPLRLLTNSSERFRITPEGLFGFNTTSPTASYALASVTRSGTTSAVGAQLDIGGISWTDSNVAASGTVAAFVANRIALPTVNTTNSGTTYTTVSNWRVNGCANAGANTQITNCNALIFPTQAITGTVANTYQLFINGPMSGGTNNYAASIAGNVGMGGVTDPTAPLSIAAQGVTPGTHEQLGLRSQRIAIVSGNLISGITFRSNDTSNTAPGIITASLNAQATATHTASVLDTALTFNTTTGTTFAEKMRILGNGNVGIGTTAPGNLLDLSKSNVTAYTATSVSSANPFSASDPVLKITNSNGADNDGAFIGFSTKAGDGTYNQGYIGAIAKSGTWASNIVFGNRNASAGYSERMRIDSSGNVGIGTTAPSSALEVAGATGTALLKLSPNGGGVSNGAFIDINSRARFAYDSVRTAVQISDIGTSKPIVFDSGGTERLRIDQSGNVGIGTTAPGTALDVKGTLRLSGSSSGYVGLAPAAAAGSTTYTLPSSDGASGQVLQTNGSGTMSWRSVGGAVVQETYCEFSTPTTLIGYSTIPLDNTIPQQTEGAEVMTCSITPQSASNNLLVEAHIWVDEGNNVYNIVAGAIFRDSTADAIAAGIFAEQNISTALMTGNFVMRKRVSAASTSATTFKFRIAEGNGTNSININKYAGGNVFNGTYISTMTIKEIVP